MTKRPVILFMFAGRRQNLDVNLPMIRRIVDENPQVQCHIWDLARNKVDSDYLKTISGDRIEVKLQYGGPLASRHMNKVWNHYTDMKFQDSLFVKVDDDVVFIQTEKFGEFVDAVEANPRSILTAEVVNNGACTQFMPELWAGFEDLDIPLLEVHESNEYAQLAHGFMAEHWRELVSRPTALVDIEDWVSINFIGMHWNMLGRMNLKIGRRAPEWIAGRHWRTGSRIGDEGAANMFPRKVMSGFTVGHLGFGPQDLTPDQEDQWRAQYALICREYLASVAKRNTLAREMA